MTTAKSPNWLADLQAFYQFIDGARHHLKHQAVDAADQALVEEIDQLVSREGLNREGKLEREQKFVSAIQGDVERLVMWQSYLANYSNEELQRMQDFIALELNGLTGDMQPRAILTASRPAAIITGLSLAAAWSALGAVYFGVNIFDIAVEVLVKRLQGIDWLRWLFSIIFVVGGFLGIAWYVSASFQNQQQLQLLHSLNRAITLRLIRT